MLDSYLETRRFAGNTPRLESKLLNFHKAYVEMTLFWHNKGWLGRSIYKRGNSIFYSGWEFSERLYTSTTISMNIASVPSVFNYAKCLHPSIFNPKLLSRFKKVKMSMSKNFERNKSERAGRIGRLRPRPRCGPRHMVKLWASNEVSKDQFNRFLFEL